MDNVLQTDGLQVRYRLLGRATGGFHTKYAKEEIVASNIADLRNSFGNDTATLMVAKGDSKVINVDSSQQEVECDALLTMQPSHNLLLRPADCIPLLLYTDSPKMLALVHCSRTSLEAGIIENTIFAMVAQGVVLANCRAHICPGIAAATYVLPSEVVGRLQHPSWRGQSMVSDKGTPLNLTGFIVAEMLRLGIAQKHVLSDMYDTATDPAFYSHYQATRNGDVNGRNGFACTMV